MPRQLPKEWRDETVKIPDLTPKTDQYITQVREYELITPLFGGGVETQKADPITVVRATEVRGQLRFWWRATRGGQFGGDLAAMKKEEDRIWGSSASFDKNGKLIGGPSQVQVTLESKSKPVAFDPIDHRGNPAPHVGNPRSRHSYVAFPLNKDRGSVQVGVKFKITLRYPSIKVTDTGSQIADEVEAALWAWETFGGLGGRTRRGFGAVSPTPNKNLPKLTEIQSSLQDSISALSDKGNWHPDVPHLESEPWRLVLIKPGNIQNWNQRVTDHGEDELLAMWDYLIEELKQFRQDRSGKDAKDARFGRSWWPEADAIRDITNHKANYTDQRGVHDHRTPKITLNGKTMRVFPRAVFGLPLIFQFKDKEQGDPETSTIEYGIFRRWASPLILRPLKCRDGVLGVALVLKQPEMIESDLHFAEMPNEPIRIHLSPAEAKEIRMLDGNTDVLRAFLNYLERK